MIRMDVSRMKSWLEKSTFGLPPFVTEAASRDTSSDNGSEKRAYISYPLAFPMHLLAKTSHVTCLGENWD